MKFLIGGCRCRNVYCTQRLILMYLHEEGDLNKERILPLKQCTNN